MAKSSLKADIVADYFLFKAQGEERPLTNKKLQKLLYYAQAWSLVIRKQRLFTDKIEAWVHGPAIRKVYIRFKKFGFNPITEKTDEKELKNIPTDVKSFLDDVWKVYGKLPAQYLEALTHSEEPWQKAREGLEAYQSSDNTIKVEVMKKFYTKRMEEANSVQIA